MLSFYPSFPPQKLSVLLTRFQPHEAETQILLPSCTSEKAGKTQYVYFSVYIEILHSYHTLSRLRAKLDMTVPSYLLQGCCSHSKDQNEWLQKCHRSYLKRCWGWGGEILCPTALQAWSGLGPHGIFKSPILGFTMAVASPWWTSSLALRFAMLVSCSTACTYTKRERERKRKAFEIASSLKT